MASGSKVLALDAPSIAFDEEPTDETAFTSTTYIVGAAATCGTAFIAPTSGTVLINFSVRMQSNSANTRAAVSVQVASGATLGSGTVASAANDDNSVETSQGTTGGSETRITAGNYRVVTGLTAGATYNVVTMHHMLSAGNATIFNRTVSVSPGP